MAPLQKQSTDLAESYLKRALNKQIESKNHLEGCRYAESVSASQECIELSIKASFLLLDIEPPKDHKFTQEQFGEVLRRIPAKLTYRDFAKVYLYSMFWSMFYTVAKYGLEKVQVGPDKLFEKEEAELALKHAQRCRDAAGDLANYVRFPW